MTVSLEWKEGTSVEIMNVYQFDFYFRERTVKEVVFPETEF